MRVTSDAETYDYNSFVNIAYSHFEFEIPPNMLQPFSEDDSCFNGVPKIRQIIASDLPLTTLDSEPRCVA
ncbi:31460_t:CDS:1, partial [Racocetra persica]